MEEELDSATESNNQISEAVLTHPTRLEPDLIRELLGRIAGLRHREP